MNLESVEKEQAVADIVGWLEDLCAPECGVTLNVAGYRESKCPGIEEGVFEIMRDVLGKKA